MERIGFIGLGSQGGPIAHRIIDAGMPLSVWARRPEALEPFTAKGAAAAATVAELGNCQHVGICVINDADVLQICHALIPAMKPGSRIAIHSTILPETCVALAQRCADAGIDLIDAPVSGGRPAAEAGTLTVMCGGSKNAFEASLPVLKTFGKAIVLLGDVGSGQRAKIVNNALMAANMGLAHAALVAGEALGIERSALSELVNVSSGRSFGFQICSSLPSPVTFAHGAALLAKDVNLLNTALPNNASVATLAASASSFLEAALRS